MQTLTLKVRADQAGIAHFEIPTQNANQEFEIVLVLQLLEDEPVDAMGYPIGFFERLDAIEADDLIERPAQLPLETRDEVE